MSYILGLNAYHGDSSACLIKDRTLIAAGLFSKNKDGCTGFGESSDNQGG